MYIEDVTTAMLCFATHQLKQFQPQVDYKELLNFIIIFLGERPAGLHRARWMAKAIYALKIYVFV